MFEFDQNMAKKDEDVFHFIGYIPIGGRLYELDGLKNGPIDLGAVAVDGDWLNVVRPVIEKRIQKYSADEIHFNLMAIVSDMKMLHQRHIDEHMKKIEAGGMETEESQAEITRLQQLIADEEQKRLKYRIENIRRRHNYLPFIMELLKILAEQGKLVELVEKAKEKTGERKKKEKEKKEAKPTTA